VGVFVGARVGSGGFVGVGVGVSVMVGVGVGKPPPSARTAFGSVANMIANPVRHNNQCRVRRAGGKFTMITFLLPYQSSSLTQGSLLQ
jgi:hypothetical protein